MSWMVHKFVHDQIFSALIILISIQAVTVTFDANLLGASKAGDFISHIIVSFGEEVLRQELKRHF